MMDEKDKILCRHCGSPMFKEWFTEYEEANGIKTGRKRMAVSCLRCPQCFCRETVDDSFDGEWR